LLRPPIVDALSALSLPSFAGGIAGVASGLPLCFDDGFPRGSLGEFRMPESPSQPRQFSLASALRVEC
jgi:hypothetical protein